MSSLETLSNFHNRIHPVAVEILALLNILQNRDFDVLFCWIPGHVGIVGNNLADNAAKTASSFLQREIPCCDAKKSFARRLQSLWQESWDRQTNNKLHILRPTISSWPCMPVRELDVKVTRLRIGHTRFTHRHLLFGERAPTCSRCQIKKAGKWETVKESKAAKRARILAGKRNQDSSLLNKQALNKQDFLKVPKNVSMENESDPPLKVYTSEEDALSDMSTSDTDAPPPSSKSS
ncbi:hypothetical protein AVEN_8784-1 [Araneus ventricosus]|uniref:Uncharacterized protein n=1 Tax=Araneus ventricosus TaxID=182803 RepID=A0A4Y2UDZ5_ARAVE|nr:hypothetical protein AVEN_8784-1 [Araneus ventricosus]